MYLYGASGHAKVIIDIIKSNNIKLEGLFDDNEKITQLNGYPVFQTSLIKSEMNLIISIGNNTIRKSIVEKVKINNFITLTHPSAIVSPSVKLGHGTVIMQGAIVQADASIGNHVILNTAVSIDHECKIANYVHISPNSTLCGNVEIGEGSWIGAGSVILPGVKIGKWSTIGAGSVVAKDIPDNSLAVGNRCKIIKTYK